MRYPMKLLHIRYNLFAGTEMLSLFVYESIAKEMLMGNRGTPRKSPIVGKICFRLRVNRKRNFAWGNRPPIWGGGRARGSGVAPRESPPY